MSFLPPRFRIPAPSALRRAVSAAALAMAMALALAPACTGQAEAAPREGMAPVFTGWGGGKTQAAALEAGRRRVKTKIRDPEQYHQRDDILTQAARRQGLSIVKGREGLQFGGVTKRLNDRVMVGVGLPGVSDSRTDYPSNVQMKYEF